jgi:antitoxin ChpS
MSELQVKRPMSDLAVRLALVELDHTLRARLGRSYRRLILLGSRARGDNDPDSDADVAIVMQERIRDRWALKRAIIRETYPILLETGLYIQAWPVEQGELDDPDKSSNPALLRNIVEEGIAL